MKTSHRKSVRTKALLSAATIGLALSVTACGGMPDNRSLYSTKQPVVERTNFTLDVNTQGSGLPISEQQRLLGWFQTMELEYGDRVSIEDPTNNPAVADTVNQLAGRFGLIVDTVAPTTEGFLDPGQARVVITRTDASVPDCPDWSSSSDMNYNNALSDNYGCAINSNLAAMVADPQDLLEGQDATGETVIATGTKAIETFREIAPTGAGGLRTANEGGN